MDTARCGDDLTGVINTASREQEQGIGRIAAAVSPIDKVTRANAATAERVAGPVGADAFFK